MRSRSTATRVGQPLQPARGGAQVALDVGQPRGAGRGDEARGRRAGRAGAATSRARRLRAAAPAARPARRSHVARARRGSRTTCAHDRGASCRPARRRRGRAAARSRPRPTPGRRPRRSARRAPRSSRPRAPRATLPCGAPASASCAALSSRPTARTRSGDGTVSSSSRRVPARIAARLRRRRLEHAHADASRPRRPAPGRRAPPGRCRAARPSRGSVADRPTRVSPWRSSAARGRGQLGAQPRAHLLAQRVEVLALGERPSPCSSSTRKRHPQVRRQPLEVPASARDRARRAARSSSRGERVEQRPAARLQARQHLRRRRPAPARAAGAAPWAASGSARSRAPARSAGHEPLEAVGAQLRRAPSAARARSRRRASAPGSKR